MSTPIANPNSICLNAGMGAPVAGHLFFKKNLYLLLIEPIGGAIPKFTTDSKSLGTFEKTFGGTLALLCPAQAFPLPSYRYRP